MLRIDQASSPQGEKKVELYIVLLGLVPWTPLYRVFNHC